ncbi:MAG: hypothetical protein AUI04_13290 [Candidatus Rokubacteria bacterium 13_2_20CM_2_64_8]|nr:MAG: hypothetical protein AUI04_13290 [Candidatus Rokubacteria bacterium 13_2_20CM_2_64_8]
MLVPPGTHVRDREGKSVGTVSRLVLHPESREVAAIVVQQGVFDRREVVVPLNKVASFEGDEVRLDLRASELAGFGLFNAPSLKEMPDHWPMPAGLDQRSFFLRSRPSPPGRPCTTTRGNESVRWRRWTSTPRRAGSLASS